METSGGSSDPHRSQTGGGSSRRYGVQFSASNFIQAPLSSLLEYSGILRSRSSHQEVESLIGDESAVSSAGGGGEVSIRIIGAGDQENLRVLSGQNQPLVSGPGREGNHNPSGNSVSSERIPAEVADNRQGGDGGSGEVDSLSSSSTSGSGTQVSDGEANVAGGNNRDSSYQRYDIQQVARWIEQILPFSLLLLVVFIRQHLQGILITAMFHGII